MVKVFYGHLVNVEMIKQLLLDNGIECMIKNEFEEGSHAGFGSGVPGSADLFVAEDDSSKAKSVISAADIE